MNDEQQVRSLLAMAAEPVDEIQPPVTRLVERGRRARKVRAALSVLGVAAVTAATFALPPVIRSLSPAKSRPPGAVRPPTGLFPARPSPQSPGPGALQLSHFRWSTLATSPLGRRSQPVLAWTGRDLLELGGMRNWKTTNEGAAFDPSSGRWRRIAPVPNTINLSSAVATWTGHDLFVTNGHIPSDWAPAAGAPAGLYDPATNRWTVTILPRQLLGLVLRAAVWTGRDVVVAGVGAWGDLGNSGRLAVASYDPSTKRWHVMTPQLPAHHQPIDLALVATSRRIILWSLWSRIKKVSKNGYAVYSGVDVLVLGSDGRWKTVTGRWPQGQVVEDPVYGSGTILIPPGQIWCGDCSHPYFDYPAYLADATTLARRTVPAGPLVRQLGIEPAIWLWNGRSALAANVRTTGPDPAQRTSISQMAVFDPKANQWTGLPVPSGRPPLAANPLWAGREVLLLTASGELLAFRG
jgi:hypothetical protein